MSGVRFRLGLYLCIIISRLKANYVEKKPAEESPTSILEFLYGPSQKKKTFFLGNFPEKKYGKEVEENCRICKSIIIFEGKANNIRKMN